MSETIIRDNRQAGWFWASNDLVRRDGAKLGPYGIAIYCALAAHANADGQAWPSLKTLARTVGCSPQRARQAIYLLAELGWLTVSYRRDDATMVSLTNVYTLTAPGAGTDAQVVGTPPRVVGVLPVVEPNKNHTERIRNERPDSEGTTPSESPPDDSGLAELAERLDHHAGAVSTPHPAVVALLEQVTPEPDQFATPPSGTATTTDAADEPPGPPMQADRMKVPPRRAHAERLKAEPSPALAGLRELTDAYIAAYGIDPPGGYARQVKEAKRLWQAGWGAADVTRTVEWLLRAKREFFVERGGPLSMTTVGKYIGQVCKSPGEPGAAMRF